MKNYIAFVMFLACINMYAQDKIYLDKKYKKTNQKEHAEYYRIISQDTGNNKLVNEQTFYMDGIIKSEIKYSNYYSKKKILVKNTHWYKDGQIHIEGDYKKGKKEGYFISYWENGQLKRKDLYKKGKLTEGKCWDSLGREVTYYDFEIKPAFPGGMNALKLYLKDQINYDQISAASKGKRVSVRFSIESDGSISDVKVVKGVDVNTDREVKRLIQNMPRWKPAVQDGKKVKVSRTIPIAI